MIFALLSIVISYSYVSGVIIGTVMGNIVYFILTLASQL